MTQTMHSEFVVVGAGLVGLTATIALAQQQKSVVLVDATSGMPNLNPGWDARIYALTEGTVDWLKTIGVWQHVNTHRVNRIDAMMLWSPKREKPLKLTSDDANLLQMGCILESQNLLHACWLAIQQTNVTVITDAVCLSIENTPLASTLRLTAGTDVKEEICIASRLLVAADGANSWVREQARIGVHQKPFNQVAIVANFEAERAHHDVASQWFGAHETLALLPLPQQMVSMVWAVSTERAAKLLTLSSEALIASVAESTQHALGALTQVGQSMSFALNQKTAVNLIGERLVLVGDAAHQVHPMAGQGVNLGFRDVMKLALMVQELHAMQDVGDVSCLRQYERARKIDVAGMHALTGGLDILFAVDSPKFSSILHGAMVMLNQQTGIKKYMVQHATL